MIARIWKGWATPENAPRYEELFINVVLMKVTGYKGANLLKREAGNEIEFTTIFWFESLEAVKRFAGENFEQAVVPDQVKELLCHYEETVHHHEVAL